ncbi:MAG TPA: VOC family protein [Vicinamibacterales bacterium]|jgi:catechol 2,3-dioxygenase-like lactoylglutathione lyase family enzyme
MRTSFLPLAIALLSQGASAPAPVVSSVNGAFFAVSVKDIDASSRWYSEKLGMRAIMQLPKQDKAAVTVLEGGGLTVELVQLDDAAPAGRQPELVHGIFKSGVVVADLAKTIAMLKERGVPIAIGPFPARGSTPANFLIRDNAGNLIQFFGR